MNVKICDIATAIENEGTKIPISVHEMLAQLPADADDNELAMTLFNVRRVMLDIVLRLRGPDKQDRNKLALAADHQWDGDMCDGFVERAIHNLDDTEIKAAYDEAVEEADQPLNDFLNHVSKSVGQDMGVFLFEQLSK